jgi:HlyD family secretion protein
MNGERVLTTPGASGTSQKDGATSPAPAKPQRPALPALKAKKGMPKWLLAVAAVVVAALAYFGWTLLQPEKLPDGFASSNGRIEATEVNVATKSQGRLVEILVDEGDYVTAGQIVARMDTDSLKAQLKEAQADLARSESAVTAAQSTVAQRQSEKAAAEAVVLQRDAELDLASKNLVRTEKLYAKNSAAAEELDSRKSAFYGAKAALSAAKANVASADAALVTAQSQVVLNQATVKASQAKVEKLEVDIAECTLKAPRDGRVQYRVAQPGEVLAAGGRVLNMIDLTDVYMTFFLPTAAAGRVKQGAEVRLVLDAAAQFVIPAKATFVADVAQFTPKTVETTEERQKLTFRIKAHIPPDVLRKYIHDVKTGLPGVAYVQLEPPTPWPAKLEVKLPQ